MLWASAYQTALMLKVRVVLLLPESGSIVVKAGYPPEDCSTMRISRRRSGPGKQPPGGARFGYPARRQAPVPADAHRSRARSAWSASTATSPGRCSPPTSAACSMRLMDQAALAIERVHLVEDIERVKRTMETERLRSALLTSISHDLKTPLAAVLGAAGTLQELRSALTDAQKTDLLATIVDEAERLNRFIANLLDMTRLESGAIVPNTALAGPGGDRRLRAGAREQDPAQHRVEIELAADLPMVELDAVLFEQVLFNLLDNAAKYAPPGTTIRIQSWRDEESVVPAGARRGRRHSAGRSGAIFDKFYRAQKGDQVRAGTGLGLAISAALSRPCRERSSPRTAPTERGGVHHPAADPGRPDSWIPPHERRPAPGPGGGRRAADPQAVADGPGTQGYQILEAPNGKDGA